jgi:hypothetical protein
MRQGRRPPPSRVYGLPGGWPTSTPGEDRPDGQAWIVRTRTDARGADPADKANLRHTLDWRQWLTPDRRLRLWLQQTATTPANTLYRYRA